MYIIMVSKIEKIYSDGACSGNPGPGGWGCVVVFSDGSTHEIGGMESNTTNNQMELKGAIAGLEFLLASGQRETVEFYIDSQYVQKGITEWIEGWKLQGWRNSSGKLVKNRELWQQLDNLNSTLSQLLDAPIDWRYVQAHAGHIHNERCDAIAVAFSQNKVPNLVVSDTPVVLGDGRERQSNNRSKISHAKFKEQKHLNKQTQMLPPVNIYSKSPDWLGASLTNPTTVAEYWATKRQSGIKDKFPVFFGGKFWKDAEEAYQYFKQDVPLGSKREKLMASILEAKLNQYPELITEIDKRGGRLWLETCEHRVNGGFWEGKGTDSPFISALSKAYERASLRLRQKEADSTMTVAFSGSRAKYFKACPNWDKRAKNSLRDMVKTAFDTAFSLNYDRLTFVTGMATGIDQWGAIEAMRLRQQQRQGLLKATPKIEVLASVPCIGQERVWNQKDKDRYFKLLSLTDDVHLVSREFYKSPVQLFDRNDDMLNRLTGKNDMLLVVQVAGSRGTQDAINKALSQGKELLLYEPDKKGTQEQRYTYFAKETEGSTPPSPELAARLMAMKKEQIVVEQVQFQHSPNSQEVEL
ncbi:SLOG family protein [Coleofasciculus sp. G3-WIS-01]|uniref:SLOG family protein n=1 Tax=Coleofasciculus sp. G3-WIS-01 TaxID=3069528 RepID=UPI00406384EB